VENRVKVGGLFERVDSKGGGPKVRTLSKERNVKKLKQHWKVILESILLAALVGYGLWTVFGVRPPEKFIDPVLYEYKVGYDVSAEVMGLKPGNEITRLEFGKFDNPSWLGVCYRHPYFVDWKFKNYYTIKIIDAPIDPTLLSAVIWHELTHCEYNIGHAEDFPDSLMYPYIDLAADMPTVVRRLYEALTDIKYLQDLQELETEK
jgi:hypothetical protein